MTRKQELSIAISLSSYDDRLFRGKTTVEQKEHNAKIRDRGFVFRNAIRIRDDMSEYDSLLALNMDYGLVENVMWLLDKLTVKGGQHGSHTE